MAEEIEALVVGAGPAGLMAAEELAAAGLSVTVAEAMPSPARKLLMAGKSGLNLTKDEPEEAFRAAYGPLPPALSAALSAFGPAEAMAWAEGLGQPLFTGSTGRVFPTAMKASPLLRAWLARLSGAGVTLRRRWRWTGFDGPALTFNTPEGPARLAPRVTVLALGGASWRRLGSDGAWASRFDTDVAPFAPANAGLRVHWSSHMAPHFGRPVKGLRLTAGALESRGEIVLSAQGIEGGGIYPLTPALRAGAPLRVDLLPDLAEEEIRARLARQPRKLSTPNRLRRALSLPPEKLALLMEFARPLPADLAPRLKALPLRHSGLCPLDEAISTAGGLRFAALDEGLMLRSRPGTFAAGEMLDWEAPTGGYLITACLATGRHAGRAAAAFARR
ncbi:TIGR03862 family flavoprotein [Pseudoroseicyclus tamaricis]|uniref:TIGR03862 family flavoprotein n=1 Tax=Pseudoroseicyclus tamaricis TaxID=2705421 RepID=A0A6B2JLV7_9RHOB|nr:TIGR03862 family flavoprotein [Pseudoroseicyclus tamaricis]NDV02551.1 TIGR03862 family flavoprotein [Pseudoroseicyclus tamaricis]